MSSIVAGGVPSQSQVLGLNQNNSGSYIPTAQLSQQADSFEGSKKGGFSWAKAGFWTLVTAGIAIGADYVFAKGKHVNSLKKSLKESAAKLGKEYKNSIAKSDKNITVKSTDAGEAKYLLQGTTPNTVSVNGEQALIENANVLKTSVEKEIKKSQQRCS